MTALRIFEVFDNSCRALYFSLVSYSFLALHGFFNALAFRMNSTVNKILTNNYHHDHNTEDIEQFFTNSTDLSSVSINSISMQRK